jgi:hypothetical protein
MAENKSPKSSNQHKEVIRTIADYRMEAEQARATRMRRNRMNWDLYMGNIDWSHKGEGQSTEHLPKVANSAEQLKAFVKRALTQFGPWFSMDLPKNSVLTPEQARSLLMRFLNNVVVNRTETRDFATLLGDSVMQALFESLLIFKVHGTYRNERTYRVEPGNLLAGTESKLMPDNHDVWRLRIDLIPSQDYYPDPTTRGLYEIHRVERDWIDVWNMAEHGVYDKTIVQSIHDDMMKSEKYGLKARHRGQDETYPLSRRKRLVVEECWGTLLGPDGRPLNGQENTCTTIINDKYVVREPTPIADIFWDGESPIVKAPIVRVPHSVWHKALFDNAAQLNLAIDEIFNLILDGGIASVWGVRQVREHLLADPRQISNGIPQGATLVINEDAPLDAKAVEQVSTGSVPPEALSVFGVVDREYGQAALTNDVRLGNLPVKQVKATELVQADQNSSVLIDSFASDLEREAIEKVLKKSWLRLMQFADDIPASDVVDAVGVSAAFKLSRMSEAQRYAMFAQGLSFHVNGLSGTLSKAREFQKLMAMMQGVGTNPVLMMAFLRKISPEKTLNHIMRALNINPENLELDEDGRDEASQANTAGVQQLAQITGGGSPPNAAGGPVDEQRSAINQEAGPTGMSGING